MIDKSQPTNQRLRSVRQRWRRFRKSGKRVSGAAIAALGYFLGRAAGLREPARKAYERFDTCAAHVAVLLCIYRKKNRSSVIPLVEQARRRGMKIGLWALDEPLPELEEYTVGCGVGARMELLNRLWEAVGCDDCHQLVISDDDISFTRGSLDRLLKAAIACEFGIAQPAHDWQSRSSYSINVTRPFLVARQTTFVEPGPLFVVTQPWIDRVMPFPKDFGMGWGIWVLWHQLLPSGCKLGIIDCVTVTHPSPVGTAYAPARKAEQGRLLALLREHDFRETKEAQKVLSVWKAGQSIPPWKNSL